MQYLNNIDQPKQLPDKSGKAFYKSSILHKLPRTFRSVLVPDTEKSANAVPVTTSLHL